MQTVEPDIRIVRYGELRPCRTAFIDAHTPGSDRKENFTIIGGGVSESPDQHVHIRDTPGFNVGAAGQPPHCRNSLHVHRTAEVFFVQSGRWRFFWGLHGDAGDVILEPGDLFDIPTGIFRGFENVGTDYGMIMSVLGGDDAGGGVIWAPQVIEDARAHGLVLSEQGRLYDTAKGEALPDGVGPMPPLTPDALARFPELPVSAVVPAYVARHQDMMALATERPVRVIGAQHALIQDRPGFEIEFVSHRTPVETKHISARYEVLMVHAGHWHLSWADQQSALAPGDVCAVSPDIAYTFRPAMSGVASAFRITPTDDPPGPTRSV